MQWLFLDINDEEFYMVIVGIFGIIFYVQGYFKIEKKI